jgi:rRNA maturation RNase YbeY
MIIFNYETDFKLVNEDKIRNWISLCIEAYGFKEGEINYIFCNDEYLLKLNKEFLQHDTLTDIISFDYTVGKEIGGDIFISVERVEENAKIFLQNIDNEMNRVIIHGVLHYFGFKDKTTDEAKNMRNQEAICLQKLT